MAEQPSKRLRLMGTVDAASKGRVRRPAAKSEAVALFCEVSPLAAASPYHAFASCPPTALFGVPARWPGPRGSATTARLLWGPHALYVLWELEGAARPPVKAAQVEPAVLAGLQGGAVQPSQRSILLDERVECFLWQPDSGAEDAFEADAASCGQTYYAFEINFEGRVLTNRARFGGPMGFDWDADGAVKLWTQELAVGWGASANPIPSQVPGGDSNVALKRVVVAELRWAAMNIDPKRDIRIGLHRAEHRTPVGWNGATAGQKEVDRLLSELVWSSWVDPGDDEVNFHRPSMFGRLTLAPEGSGIDCSCCAARLLRSRVLTTVPSPRPSLDECPPGSLLVQAKYASLCGSDLPYFRNSEGKAPSCYWDRDGFCGHEVIGIVLESKSERFRPGDAALALPSSYFKAHTATKQDWYKEEVHGVLLSSFPVRGGFSQVYTSHELYSCKLRECVPRMIAAQGLGTILKMARRIGPVIGKCVVVLGQGQNGLIATRLMAQLCARDVIAVEPIEHRRAVALSCGATLAVPPERAAAAVAEATGGRGADVVLEMVGHCQHTINEALELVACAGIVAAFGVPDDRVYHTFEYSTFFRKNVTLVASVVPDPAVDFPEAVRLIEQGRFSTDGLFTHTMPLSDLQKAFEMAADYKDGVVKLVVDLS